MHFAAAPLGESGLVLLVARATGPEFHRAEVLRLTLLTEVVMAMSGDLAASRDTVAPAATAVDAEG
jgi:hypothetical protein